MTNYQCTNCNKNYVSRQNLFRHKKICKGVKNADYKINSTLSPQNSTLSPQNSTLSPQNSTLSPQNSTYLNNEPEIEENKLKCIHCMKIYSRSDSLARHIKICKKRNESSEEMISKKELEKEIKNFKKEMLRYMNKAFKMHPKTFNKLQRDLKTINNNSNNTQNNNTQNNNTQNNNTLNINAPINLNVVPLGQENFRHVLSKEQQIAIVNKGVDCIKYFLNITHFNPNTPQYKSFIITNAQNNIAHIYDDDSNQYVPITKDELMFNIIDERCDDIRDFIEFHEDDIKESVVKRVNKFIDRMETDIQYNKKQLRDLRVYIYNKTKFFNIKRFKKLKDIELNKLLCNSNDDYDINDYDINIDDSYTDINGKNVNNGRIRDFNIVNNIGIEEFNKLDLITKNIDVTI
jgi:hypothetical protein